MRTLAVAITVLALGVTGIVQGQGKTDPALNKLTAAFEAAYNAGDTAKVASMYADAAVVMPPGEQMVKGRSAIEARLKKEMQGQKGILKLNPSASAISGDQAYEAGTATFAFADGRTLSEKYLVVYKRIGGEWKTSYDIWNSNVPPTPKK